MSRQDVQVVIAGAGPTGLVLACELARRGIRVRLLEKGDRLFGGSRGKGISPRLLEIFDDLGVVEEILAGSMSLTANVYQRDRLVTQVDADAGTEATVDVPYPRQAIAPQWRTQDILRRRLREWGVDVEFGHEVTDAHQDAEGVRVSVERAGATEEIRAGYLVGCDGGRSTVRRLIGLKLEGETRRTPFGAYVGDIEVTGLSPDVSHMWNDPELGFLLLTPFKETSLWQFQCLALPSADGTLPELSPAGFQRLVDDITGMPINLGRSTWISQFGVNERIVPRYRHGRVLLAGDAAHVYTPFGGQGMTTGAQDAYNLGWKLAAALAGAPDRLIDTYEAERLPVAQHALAASAQRMAQVTGQLSHPAAPPTGVLHTINNTDTSQLRITYRNGPLARAEGGSTATLAAGDRAPDGIALDPVSGARTRLFDLFRGPQWTALVFGEVPRPKTPEALYGNEIKVHRVAGPARDTYGITGESTVLVRPDGYLGAVVPGADLGAARNVVVVACGAA